MWDERKQGKAPENTVKKKRRYRVGKGTSREEM